LELTVATAALRRKKTYEQQLDQLAGTRLTLEAQANAIESANMNAETMLAMRRGAGALRDIHRQVNIDNVDATMDEIREEMERTKEIADAISNPLNVGVDIDEVRNGSFAFLRDETACLSGDDMKCD
jgi:charged multivesicular body protein 4